MKVPAGHVWYIGGRRPFTTMLVIWLVDSEWSIEVRGQKFRMKWSLS